MMLYTTYKNQKAGYCKLHITALGDWEIEYLKIESEYRGLGLATKLLNRAKRVAKRDNCNLVGFIDPAPNGLTKEQETEWLKRHGFEMQARYNLGDSTSPIYREVMIWRK